MNTATLISWLLTYLVHSTVLLGAAWLMTRIMGDRRLALQEVLLRAALVGGLLTATLQVGLGIVPVGGALAVDGLRASESLVVGSDISLGEVGATPSASSYSRAPAFWPVALLSLWVVGSTLALAVLGRSILDLRRLLQTRRFRPTGRLLDRLAAAMGLRRWVRFSTSEAIAVPFATGIRHPEICCPERVGELAHEHQRSLFAHELAHLARRDPAWQLLYRVGEAIFFLQPLNRLVRRRLEEIAEHLTDERAVACTGDRLGLARCLVVVSHWGISSRLGVPAAAFAAGPRLDRRVRHLISGTVGQPLDSRLAFSLLAVLLAASVIFLPAISATTVHAGISHDESGRVSAKTWSTASEAPPEKPAPPPAPEPASPSTIIPDPVAVPAPAVAPDLGPAAAAPAATAPVAVPISLAVPAPEAAPVLEAVPASPAAAERPPMPEEPPAPPARDEETPQQRKRERDQARAQQREEQRERSEAEARARERARALEAEARALAAESRERSREQAERSRELAREAAERERLTDAEREKLRDEAREMQRQARIEAYEHARVAREQSREQAERSRAQAREAAERARLTDAESEAIRKAAEARRAEARAQAREASRMSEEQLQELSERARRLAEEAEAERQR